MEQEYLTFSIRHEYFAIKVKYVKEVLIHQYYTKLPEIDSHIAGIVNFKGHKIPVIDTQKRLNISSEKDLSAKTIIVFKSIYHTDQPMMAANVNSIDGILCFSSDEIIRDKTLLKPNYTNEFVIGFVKYFDQSIQIINAEKFIKLPYSNTERTQAISNHCTA